MPAAPAPQAAFGLTVLSDEPLPGLAASAPGAAAHLRVRLRCMPPWLTPALIDAAREWLPSKAMDEEAGPVRVHRVGAGWFLLRYADGTRFALDPEGTEVWADWPEGITLDETATYLVGPVLGWVLRLRGTLALHASAVALDGRAVALAGPAGAGKSTAAAAFARAGWQVLADDVAALAEADGAFRVQPAYPRLRLWEDSVAALFGAADALPRLCPNWDKRYLALDGGEADFATEAAPLAAVYLLRGPEGDGLPVVTPVEPGEALLFLVANTHAGVLLDAGMRGREFEALSRLVRRVPVRRLSAPEDPRRLPELVAAVAADLAGISPPPPAA